MGKSVRLGSGSAYWGDVLEPAVKLVERGGLDYIGFDHLAELTLAILQRQRAKDPASGYIADIVPWTEATLPAAMAKGTVMVTNAGGANPPAAAEQVVQIARRHGLRGCKVGIVTGDDVLAQLWDLVDQGMRFPNLDTDQQDITSIRDQVVAANAYIGAEGIVEALEGGADVVVAGRVSDNAMFVGPLMHEFGWTYDDPQLVGAAVTIGHMLECAALATGSLSNFWADTGATWDIGFPYADVADDGSAVFSKLDGTGGLVTEMTLKEQLLYEVHDPSNYIMPDGIADFTAPSIRQLGHDRVAMTGMTGKSRPDLLKVCVGYRDGWLGEGTAMFSWPDAYAKARKGEEVVRQRLKMCDVRPIELIFEYLGVNTLHGPVSPEPTGDLNEVGLRVAARCATPAEADAVRREILHLWTLGGVGSAIAAPSRPRPVLGLWPTLMPRSAVRVEVDVIEA